jgi:hypothetical protein
MIRVKVKEKFSPLSRKILEDSRYHGHEFK